MVEVSIEIFKILYVNIKRKTGAVSLILTMQFLRNDSAISEEMQPQRQGQRASVRVE